MAFSLMSSLPHSDCFPGGYDESWGPRNLSIEPQGLARGPEQFPNRGRYVPIDDLVGDFPDPLDLLLSAEADEIAEAVCYLSYAGEKDVSARLNPYEHYEPGWDHLDYAMIDPPINLREEIISHEPIALQSGRPHACELRVSYYNTRKDFRRCGPRRSARKTAQHSRESHLPKRFRPGRGSLRE